MFDFLKKGLDWATGGIVKDISNFVDSLYTTDEERLEAKTKITKIVEDNMMRVKDMQANLIAIEAKGNFLQRSWRPLVMLAFAFVVIYSKFFAPAFGLPNTELEGSFWNLLQIGLGGYIVGRSGEKITAQIMAKKRS